MSGSVTIYPSRGECEKGPSASLLIYTVLRPFFALTPSHVLKYNVVAGINKLVTKFLPILNQYNFYLSV